MSYTSKGHSASKEHSKIGRINYENAAAQDHPDENESPEVDDKTPSTKVWKKYKALAAGQYDDGKDPATAKKARDEKAAAAQPPRPTGFASILEQYRKSKESRRGMKSMKVKPPGIAKEGDAQEAGEESEDN